MYTTITGHHAGLLQVGKMLGSHLTVSGRSSHVQDSTTDDETTVTTAEQSHRELLALHAWHDGDIKLVCQTGARMAVLLVRASGVRDTHESSPERGSESDHHRRAFAACQVQAGCCPGTVSPQPS